MLPQHGTRFGYTGAGRTLHYRRRDNDNDLLKGAVVGAAAVGIAVAIAKSGDD
jgi:hypothetical protein